VFRGTRVGEVDLARPGVVVTTPAKAHLTDGSVVLFPAGFRLERDTLFGTGTRYDASLLDSAPASPVPLRDVVGVEAFHRTVNAAATTVGSVFGLAATAVGVAALAVAIFGSCPTFYADSAGTAVLEAEGFSYSIATLFEARDVDRLRVGVDGDGVVRLEVRNEAAETHYINHLALLDVAHGTDETVVPDPLGAPLAVRGLRAPTVATARSGGDVHAQLAGADGAVFASDSATLWGADGTDPYDHVDLVFDAGGAADSVGLVLRLRNSLLTTVLLYDVMLAGQGARAVDWLGQDLERIGPALELGQWYAGTMGIRVLVAEGDGWRRVAWIRDVGPIAWKDVAVVLPAARDTLRVRLEFVADAWRIDRAALAVDVRRPAARDVAVARLTGPDGAGLPEALAAVRDADDQYLRTTPGQWFRAAFAPEPRDGPRTFLLVSQGYYVEWMRPDWLRQPDRGFTPSPAPLGEALARWRATRGDYERRFFASRLSVR
jgi:hypothetical protein